MFKHFVPFGPLCYALRPLPGRQVELQVLPWPEHCPEASCPRQDCAAALLNRPEAPDAGHAGDASCLLEAGRCGALSLRHHAALRWQGPVSELMSEWPELSSVRALNENLADDHTGLGVRPWRGSVTYGTFGQDEDALAEILALCARLVLREEWPGESLRLRSARLCQAWRQNPDLIAGIRPPRSEAPWEALCTQATALLLNGRQLDPSPEEQAPEERGLQLVACSERAVS